MCLERFDSVGWASGRASGPKKMSDEVLVWCRLRCRLFAHGPADAIAISKPHHLLPHSNPDWFHLSGAGLPRLSWKRGR